jgi:hypothetical protein
MYRDLALFVLTAEDPVADRTVDRIREKHPDFSQQDMVRRIVAQAAWRSAAVGAASCVGMELLGRVVTAADFSYQAASLYRLAAAVARARRHTTTLAERTAAAAGSLIFAGAAEVLRRGANASSRRLFGRRTPGLAFALAALAGGAAEYVSARAFARVWEDGLGRQRSRRFPWP